MKQRQHGFGHMFCAVVVCLQTLLCGAVRLPNIFAQPFKHFTPIHFPELLHAQKKERERELAQFGGPNRDQEKFGSFTKVFFSWKSCSDVQCSVVAHNPSSRISVSVLSSALLYCRFWLGQCIQGSPYPPSILNYQQDLDKRTQPHQLPHYLSTRHSLLIVLVPTPEPYQDLVSTGLAYQDV